MPGPRSLRWHGKGCYRINDANHGLVAAEQRTSPDRSYSTTYFNTLHSRTATSATSRHGSNGCGASSVANR
jgi:hypothetical protein